MESREVGYLIGVTVGLVIGLLLVVVLLKFSRKDGSLKCKYDERQELVRGRGFKYGFFTLLVYELFYMMYGYLLEGIVIREVIIIFGMALSVLVYVSYAILKDGYIAMNENPRRVEIVFLIVGAVNIFVVVMSIAEGHFFENGVISYSAVNLIVGVMILCVLALLLVKKYGRIKSLEGQEDE